MIEGQNRDQERLVFASLTNGKQQRSENCLLRELSEICLSSTPFFHVKALVKIKDLKRRKIFM